MVAVPVYFQSKDRVWIMSGLCTKKMGPFVRKAPYQIGYHLALKGKTLWDARKEF